MPNADHKQNHLSKPYFYQKRIDFTNSRIFGTNIGSICSNFVANIRNTFAKISSKYEFKMMSTRCFLAQKVRRE